MDLQHRARFTLVISWTSSDAAIYEYRSRTASRENQNPVVGEDDTASREATRGEHAPRGVGGNGLIQVIESKLIEDLGDRGRPIRAMTQLLGCIWW